METQSPEPLATESVTAEPAPDTVYDRSNPSTDARLPSEAEYPRNYEPTEGDEPTAEHVDDHAEEAEPDRQPPSKGEPQPPASLNAKAREQWGKLPREMQDYITQRETEAHAKITTLGNDAKASTQLSEIISRNQDVIPRGPNGQSIPAPQILNHLLAAHRMLETNPRGALAWLSKHYNVNPAEMAEPDPVEHARNAERARIEAELQRHGQVVQQQYEQQVSAELDRFAADKPHWSRVENEILYHCAAIRTTMPPMPPMQVLQMAYEKALAAHPEIDPAAQARTAAQLREARRKADDAKRAASINIRSRSSGSPAVASQSMEATMAQVYERLHGH
jgi:hypothetical protein